MCFSTRRTHQSVSLFKFYQATNANWLSARDTLASLCGSLNCAATNRATEHGRGADIDLKSDTDNRRSLEHLVRTKRVHTWWPNLIACTTISVKPHYVRDSDPNKIRYEHKRAFCDPICPSAAEYSQKDLRLSPKRLQPPLPTSGLSDMRNAHALGSSLPVSHGPFQRPLPALTVHQKTSWLVRANQRRMCTMMATFDAALITKCSCTLPCPPPAPL